MFVLLNYLGTSTDGSNNRTATNSKGLRLLFDPGLNCPITIMVYSLSAICVMLRNSLSSALLLHSTREHVALEPVC